ncbi:hypothetical protein LZG04_19165 [Saccharothrix sp. S26]|uniref:hypothetical protein n=1 Tax=Saccharothrix sp. S26 TaxID=2907215 RepID=UPI001F3E2EFE|nr:hypothetical protein [Saccharothrix sp. S26]MCE6996905.1 hypothetical protein [Saccharothrix sp. S26]
MRRSAALLVATTAALATVAAPAIAEPAATDNAGLVARSDVSLDKANRPVRPYGTKGAQTAGQGAEAEEYLGTRFIPVAPRRVLDTRSGLGTNGSTAPVGAGGQIEVQLTDLPAYTLAVVLNVTGTSPTAYTYVTVWEGGAVDRPGVSTLNLVPGDTRANSVTTWVSLDQTVNLYNNAGSTHLIADVAGYYVYDNPGAGFTTPGRYFATGPTRVYDSRNTGGAFYGGESRAIDFSSYGVPSGATAVSLNVTGVDATASTYVTAWPSGSTRPTASSLNVVPGAATPNGVTVALGSDRKVNLYNNAGFVNLIVDITGYYLPTENGGADFYPVNPGRAYDTREPGASGPIPAGQALTLYFVDQGLFPGDSLLLNLTGTEPTANTYVTPYPAGQSRPNTSALNLAPGQTAPNMATVRLGSVNDNGTVYPAHEYYNNAGNTHLVIDVFGIFG